MNRVTSFLVQAFSRSPAAVPAGGVAQQLMERASAVAGHDQHEAHALREAANAFLRVAR